MYCILYFFYYLQERKKTPPQTIPLLFVAKNVVYDINTGNCAYFQNTNATYYIEDLFQRKMSKVRFLKIESLLVLFLNYLDQGSLKKRYNVYTFA